MLSQQQYTKELAEAERYHNSEARHQSNDTIIAMLKVGGSSTNNNNNNKQQYTDEENEAYNTIINNIKDPQELYAILHEMKQKRLHRTTNNNNKPRRRRRYQQRSKSKRRVSRSSSSGSDDTPTLDIPSSTTESSTSFIDTLSNLLFPFHSIFTNQEGTTDNDTIDEDTPVSSSFDNILSFLGYDNSNDSGIASHYECGSSDSTTNAESTCSSFDSSTANNLADSFFNIMWNKKKSSTTRQKYYRRSSSVSSSAISPRNVEDSWVTKDELNEW